ncbi:Fic family protein [Candidatus Poriferisocius sp.]|uniref:Fic family protein n=1 Tax=Candidatus Poriferisocius sp. TaxID=3101276 RepID=UPI003B0292B1
MHRGATGDYRVTAHGGEEVRAFVPKPLPPVPPIQVDGQLLKLLEAANRALGRLDAVSSLLPDKSLLLYSYVRKEAVLSAQIEGTQSSLTDLLQHERGTVSGVPRDDVAEVSCYVAALGHGLKRLRDDNFPLSNRLIREVHGVLLSSGRGSKLTPGEFRRSQNWIGGTRPGNAEFVPPPHTEVENCMASLERFLHPTNDGLADLVRVGLAHVQLETIHPFQDGNGRVGRLLITFLLCHLGLLQDPLLYLSLYLKQNRSEYYRLLTRVRLHGDWEAWIAFFLEGVRVTANSASDTARHLSVMFRQDAARINTLGRPANSTRRVHEALMALTICSIPKVCDSTGLSYPGALAGMERLVELGIAEEIPPEGRSRTFVYRQYLDRLIEGTEPL